MKSGATSRIFVASAFAVLLLGRVAGVPGPGGGVGAADGILDARPCAIGSDGTQLCPGTVGEDASCFDKEEREKCLLMAKKGGCIGNFTEMRTACRKSCTLCGNFMVLEDETTGYRSVLASNLYSVFPQEMWPENMGSLKLLLNRTDEYMYGTVYTDPKYDAVKKGCKNRHEMCLHWANRGECEVNPSYMEEHCAPSCLACHKLLK